MAQQLWVLGNEINRGLAERGNTTLDPTPINTLNGSAVGNHVLEMRQGMKAESLTGSGFTGPVLWIGHFVTNAGVEEIWAAANNAGTPAMARLVLGVWTPVAFSDVAVATDLLFMQGVAMNGKFFLAYNSNVNRLHVWDGTQVRRVGVAPPGAATSAPVGGGGAAVTRSYRQRYLVTSGGVVRRRSEPGPVTTVTTTMNVTVFQSTPTVEQTVLSAGETAFWELEAADVPAGPWYLVQWFQPIATASVVDNIAVLSIPTTIALAPELGRYETPPSAKFLSTDGLSLMMGGAWETTATAGNAIPKQNRVWFTPPVGASDIGDDERINDTVSIHGWTDIGDLGPITALQGPMYGETFVFKRLTVAKLTPTGNVDAPYALSVITNVVGCVDQRLLSMGEVAGTPAVLFADANAVYALTAQGGIACISEPIGVSLRAYTIVSDPGLLIYDPLQRSLLLNATNAVASVLGTNRNFLFDCYKQRWDGFGLGGAVGGWVLGVSQLGIDTILGGGGAKIYNGCYAEQNGERRLYLCGATAADAPTISSRGGQATLDLTEPFTATVRYRKVFKPGYKATVGCPTVYFTNPSGPGLGDLTLTLSYIKNFDDETTSQSKVLAPTDFQSRIAMDVVTFEGVMSADVVALDLLLSLRYAGAAYTPPVPPLLSAVVVPYELAEALAQ